MEFLVWFLIFATWHGIGITLGYHRLLAHKAAKANKILVYLLAMGGYLALQGAPISWVATHRYHHQVTDTDKDPHTPLKGFWYAFNGWIWSETEPSRDHLVLDLFNDYPLLVFFGTGGLPSRKWLNLSCFIGWRIFLLVILGPVVALASLLAGVFVYFLPQLINTLCHMPKLGKRNYETKDLSTNISWLSYFTFGEAWHNNHHAKPKRLKQGDKGEFDITYEVAKILRMFKLMDF